MILCFEIEGKEGVYIFQQKRGVRRPKAGERKMTKIRWLPAGILQDPGSKILLISIRPAYLLQSGETFLSCCRAVHDDGRSLDRNEIAPRLLSLFEFEKRTHYQRLPMRLASKDEKRNI